MKERKPIFLESGSQTLINVKYNVKSSNCLTSLGWNPAGLSPRLDIVCWLKLTQAINMLRLGTRFAIEIMKYLKLFLDH